MVVYTFQDLEAADDLSMFIKSAIDRHRSSNAYRIAQTADLYDRQLNATIGSYVKTLYTLTGEKVRDPTATTSRIACNFFNRLNTQRVMYSLGNGVSFLQPDEKVADGDRVKESLGEFFDHDVTDAAYYALIHGVSYPFWNLDRLHVFKLTEFVPFMDEHTGDLRAGVRFWRLDGEDVEGKRRPMSAVLYREEGYSMWREDDGSLRPLDVHDDFSSTEELRPYKTTYTYTLADGNPEVVGEEGYGSLPIVPMYASRLKQSTLVGMREAIDSYDLIRSGFASDMEECAMIYWIVENAGGMTDEDLIKFRDTLKFQHIANADVSAGSAVKPYVQEVPHVARSEYLKMIRDGIYEDFGALDVHTVAAGSTNDHIDAAYQPMDENAADFEYWVGTAIRQILALQGIDDAPVFKRQRISNQKEQVEMVVMEAQWLDSATVLRKLPNISAEEVAAIIEAMDAEDMGRFGAAPLQLETELAEEVGSDE